MWHVAHKKKFYSEVDSFYFYILRMREDSRTIERDLGHGAELRFV
jgi:hypothetical protein